MDIPPVDLPDVRITFHMVNVTQVIPLVHLPGIRGVQMDDYKSIVSYQTQDHGYIRIKLRQLLDERQVTRNKLRTLTGVKYDVINRYYQAERVQMVDLDFLAKVCCVFGCEISDLLEYCPQPETRPENE